MKRALLISLALALMLSFSGCGDGKSVIGDRNRFKESTLFHEGVLQYQPTQESIGYVDKSGKVLFEAEADSGGNYVNGAVTVCKREIDLSHGSRKLWSYYNRNGKMLYSFYTSDDERRWFDFSGGLAPICSEDIWGYLDINGKVAVAPQFEAAEMFSENLAAVQRDGKWGYINKRGKPVTEFVYTSASDFSEGLAAVQQNGKWGYINKNGKPVTEFVYDDVRLFTEGLAAVQQNGKWGLLRRNGKLAAECIYESISDRHNGLWIVQNAYRHGLIDKNGRFVLPMEYDRIVYLESGGFWLLKQELGGIANEKGKITVPVQYSLPWWEGNQKEWIRIEKDGLFGLANWKTGVIIPPQYEATDPFSEGLAGAKLNGKYGYINAKGQWVIQPQFDAVNSFANGKAVAGLEGQLGLINTKGEFVSELQPMADGTPCDNGYFHINKKIDLSLDLDRRWDGYWYGYLNTDGKIVADTRIYEDLHASNSPFIAVKQNGKWGVVNHNGEFAVEPQYDVMSRFYDDGYIHAYTGETRSINRSCGTLSVIDTAGKVLLSVPCTYRYIWEIALAAKQ